MSKITTLALAAALTIAALGVALKASVSETAAGPLPSVQIATGDLQRNIDTSAIQVQLMADQTYVFGQ